MARPGHISGARLALLRGSQPPPLLSEDIMKKTRITPLPLIVGVAVVALVLGTFGTAQASGLSRHAISKIVAKVIDKKAPTLSVAHASTADTATNTDKVDGFDASSLVRATGTSSSTDIAGFNTATYTTILSKV